MSIFFTKKEMSKVFLPCLKIEKTYRKMLILFLSGDRKKIAPDLQ